MKPRKNQIGGRKEAVPLARVGRESHGSDQEKVYVPTDAEYTYYQELFQEYFEKLTRWQDIFKQFQESISPDPENRELYTGDFLVIQTPDGRAIRPDPQDSYENKHNPDLVIQGWATKSNNPSSYYGENNICEDMIFRPGISGKHLLVDVDNTPITNIDITVNSLIPRGEPSLRRKLSITADLTDHNPGRGRRVTAEVKYVAYEFQENTLHILRGKDWIDPMSDAYATHLFETLDCLIPGSTSITQQPEQRRSIEPPKPKLPPARRRPTGQ